MTEATLLLISQLVETGINEAPAFGLALQKLFASGVPTASDFASFRASLVSESYGQLVPNSDLPASLTGV